MSTTTTAIVTVTLELQVADTWGSECTIGQVFDQAERSAAGIVSRSLRECKGQLISLKVNKVSTTTVKDQ